MKTSPHIKAGWIFAAGLSLIAGGCAKPAADAKPATPVAEPEQK